MTPSSRYLALAVTIVLAADAAAEIPKPPADASRVRQLVAQMRSGTVRVRDPDAPKADHARNVAAIKTVAEWLAFTLATPPYNGEPVPREDKTPAAVDRSMRAWMEEVEHFTAREGYGLPTGSGNQGKVSPEQLEYAAEFGKAIADATKIVLDNSARPIERINTVRMMSIVARIPAPALADSFVAIISNEKTAETEKLYAFQGLKNLLEQTEVLDPTVHISELRRDPVKMGAIAQALTKYIMQKRTPRDDKEKAVIEFIRRHAVEAMAQFKEGVLRKPNKDMIFRPSWTLARIMEQDPTAYPPFTIQEQMEAAIGFCKQKVDPDMNLDVAAYTLAKISVIFARAANLDSERAGRDGTLPSMHWRVAAARLSHALATWREAAKPLPKTRFPETVVTLATTANVLLALVEKEGAGARTGAEVQAVTTWATDNPPKAWPMQNATLFKDDPESILPFRTAATLKTPDPKKAADPKATDAKKGPDPKTADPKKGSPDPSKK